jgi:hypothetical protein
MTRCSGFIVVSAVALVGLAMLPGCNNPSCGPGTQQQQQKDGSLKCVPVDRQEAQTPCLLDGGAAIVGGNCVGAVTCGPGTTLINGQCVGTGGGGVECANPNPGFFCVTGNIKNLVDTSAFTGMIAVAVYDPFTFLMGGNPLDAGFFTEGFYIFPNVAVPSFPLIIVVTGDMDKMNTTYVNTGTGAQGIVSGGKYRVDAYATPKSVQTTWFMNGFDINPSGGYLAKYYLDTKPAPTALIANETMPAAGVTLTKDGSPNPAGIKYFNTDLTNFSTGTATTTVGAAIVPIPVTGGSFPTISGMSSTVSAWEQLPGGSAGATSSAGAVIIVTRFHPQ